MRHTYDYIRKNPVLLLVIVPAFFFHMLMIMPSGTYRCVGEACGIYFYGVHANDSIWHLALAAVSFNEIPFISPVYAGALLSGYNILLDLVIFIFSKLGLPPLYVFFKLLPVLWFILFTYLLVKLGRMIKNSVLFVSLLLFFFFFSGSFGYFLTLFHSKTIEGSTGLLAMQSSLMMTNLQLALSFALLLAELVLVYQKKWSMKRMLILSLIVALQVGLKFYGGVISIFVAGLYLLEYLARSRNLKKVFIYGLVFSVLQIIAVIVFYNPFVSLQSGSILIFAPFSLVHSMIESPNLFFMPDLVQQRYFLYSVNPMSMRLLLIELFSVFLFVFMNFGVRFIGMFYTGTKALIAKNIQRFDVYLTLIIFFATLISVLFIQKGIWWNTVQFFYYAIFIGNFFSAYVVYDLIKSKKIVGIIIGLILMAAVFPSNLEVMKGFTELNGVYIPDDEISALQYLKERPDGILFSAFHIIDQEQKSRFADTSYVSAFTGKQEYINNWVQLELTDIDFKERYNEVKFLDCSFLEHVDYIYYDTIYSNKMFGKCREELTPFGQTFSNDMIRIFER
ncbi:hypothetical protein IPM65_00570 [Candidatus Roizmanbacteria bacterium]|nr:MAG: hypothetical protein IPM65_00570 [Candidatus Roizmanbacteria bacterium]